MLDHKTLHQQDTTAKILEVMKGNFSLMPNEMLEYFSNADLTPTEFKICFFLMRQLLGWDYKFKPIEIAEFADGTNTSERLVKESLKSLVSKTIILKHKVKGHRTPCYGFNPNTLGRVIIKDAREIYSNNGKVIDLKTFKLSKVRKSAPSTCDNPHLKSAENCTFKTRREATRADTQASKDTEIHLNTLSEEKINKNDWSQVRAYLLLKYPKDGKRLDGTYKQIKQNGYEQEGQSPRQIANLSAWLFASYPDIRRAYEHHDGWRQQG